ncbi:MAG: ABC transporter permease [Candidatus Bipolaricaulota bacterium]
MTTYIIRRLLVLIPVVIGVSIIVFFIMRIGPGDPARLMLGPRASREAVKSMRKDLGLDKPIYQQYATYFLDLLQGNLGESIRSKTPVTQRIVSRLPATLELTISAFLITVLLGITAGVISAVWQYSIVDHITMVAAMFWISMPFFWLGIVLILVFSVQLNLLPVAGRGGPVWTIAGLRHLALPAFTLGAPFIAFVTRLTRSNMLEVLNEDYIRTARSKGLKERVVISKHAFRNAMLALITFLGMRLPWLFGGAVVTETVFAWPGMGRLMVQAVFKRDYPVVQGVVLLIAVMVVLSNLAVDISYAFVDPRIRYD